MKSNKGFTLIELLAVIVILAIIALIATPTILGVIETARKGSAEQSALGYIDAVEKQVAIDMLDEKNKKVTISNGSITVPVTGLTVKGTAPSAGTITINETTGIISESYLVVTLSGKSYCVEYKTSGSQVKAIANASSTCDASVFKPGE